MCWTCDHPEATRQDYLDLLRAKTLKRGWALQYVEDDRRPFAYTIGLTEAGLPELVVTGLPPLKAMQVLNSVADYMVHETEPAPGDTITLPDDWFAEFVEVAEPTAHLAFAVELCGPDIRALQVVWWDRQGHSPWCPEFNRAGPRQPVLGMRGPGGAP
ncbi:DUF4262 domain-containing protein [Mycobacterium sp. DL440]|uniref:DUF4262 domain-containing protein n=1 Tax=Mycobacterium sp. DL440 TaxID=2675523 RepID=UPI00141E50EB|nr:DUF4262 domain-containing protein [Mycobacterium sp. DL440]